MKRKEKLNALKEEVETVSKKLQELSEEELAQVSGGEDVSLATRGIKCTLSDPTGYTEPDYTN